MYRTLIIVLAVLASLQLVFVSHAHETSKSPSPDKLVGWGYSQENDELIAVYVSSAWEERMLGDREEGVFFSIDRETLLSLGETLLLSCFLLVLSALVWMMVVLYKSEIGGQRVTKKAATNKKSPTRASSKSKRTVKKTVPKRKRKATK